MGKKSNLVGVTCAYTPTPLIEAAGFTPYRILPLGELPDRAGQILHENLCPNIKKILDRSLENDIPELAGTVFINSCDAMRRLSDAWESTRPQDKVVLVDLPVTTDQSSINFFSGNLEDLTKELSEWSGNEINDEKIMEAVSNNNIVYELVKKVQGRLARGKLEGGSKRLQEIYNKIAIQHSLDSIKFLEEVLAEAENGQTDDSTVPVYLFGNVLPDPEAFSMFESSGARIVTEDMCTGSRMFGEIDYKNNSDIFYSLAESILTRTPCARTMFSKTPSKLSDVVLEKYNTSMAKGVICHTVKFCDPYLSRIPTIREALKKEGIPFLLLEGDCTLRSMGQHKTRIEAFIEMLR